MDCQASLSMGFSGQEYWSGLPFPSPGYFPNPRSEPGSPALQEDSLPTELRVTEIKSTLEGTNSRVTEAEDRISEVEDKMVEINEAERERERIKRNEVNLRDLWDNVC